MAVCVQPLHGPCGICVEALHPELASPACLLHACGYRGGLTLTGLARCRDALQQRADIGAPWFYGYGTTAIQTRQRNGLEPAPS
jgi:hypothetical protein